ncbi:GAF and ANTAR domain-containing protein [Streptomyces sp. NPDC048419]|uniref:GAF and ANTAR domain-containing protein n=1 Tax=Streptomyces sp. NPDC048419 TaxID=3365547 RepID=UPI00371E6A20
MNDPYAVAKLVLEAAGAKDSGAPLPERLCRALTEGMPVDSASITFLPHSTARQLLCASNDQALRVEELQFEVGEGPCITAVLTDDAVTISDLHGDLTPWPLFGTRAREELSGIGAIYAFPLRHGHHVLGAIDMIHHEAHELTAETIEQGKLAAQAAATVLTPLYHSMLEAGDVVLPGPDVVIEAHWGTTHLAVDVVVEQLGVTPESALALLRARAFLQGQPLPDLAARVLAHTNGWPYGPSS